MYNLSVFLNNSKIREGDSFPFFKGNFARAFKKEDKGKEKKEGNRWKYEIVFKVLEKL